MSKIIRFFAFFLLAAVLPSRFSFAQGMNSLSDSLRRQPMRTFRDFGEEFKKQWELQVPYEQFHLPFDGSLHLPQIPPLDLDNFFYHKLGRPMPPIIIDPDEDFFEPGVPHSPFFYDHPKNFEPMPSPKIQPFKDEKKNPIKDFKGWYYENLADRGE